MSEFDLSQLFRAVAAEAPTRECIVHRARRLTYAEVDARTNRLASALHARGLGLHRERAGLSGWESGQDHVAIYMHNQPEYLEAMLACFKARAVPFNVNYRYVEEELLHLLRDADARAIVYESAFAPMVERLRAQLPALQLLLQVDDGEGAPLLPGALPYEATLAGGDPSGPPVTVTPDDLLILYTGGTTGMPKGVLWRQGDVFMAALGGRNGRGEETASLDKVQERVRRGGQRMLPAPPMMHGAANWVAFQTFHLGGTVVMQDEAHRFDPADVLRVIERERVEGLLLVGDAFGRPLLTALEDPASSRLNLSTLTSITTSGAAMSAAVKEGLMARLPGVSIIDAVGSSESGQQGVNVSKGGKASTGRFDMTSYARVLSADLSRVLTDADTEVGWLAQKGRVPLGYLGDQEKTRRTFPVVDGQRYSVPGDRARHLPNGEVEVLGRDSVTINSGGEKIFAEEVEAALKQHPAVYDAIVCGRPSERWGQEVCAVVQLSDGARGAFGAPEENLLREIIHEAEKHIARYKLPKVMLVRDKIERSPSGKPDYRWARAQFPGEDAK